MTMTSEAKRALSSTIRAMRARLLEDLHGATESTYRLAIRARDAGLDAVKRTRRRRFESWMREQVRAQDGQGKGKARRTAEDYRLEAEQQAAYTLLNRLLLLRLMEAKDADGVALRQLPVVTSGWENATYKDFRQLAPALVQGDDTEGYAFLLRLVFEELAIDLPGLYGPAGIAELIPIPAATLRYVVAAFDKSELESCWSDDMTLGWVYQYWNDPEREALDAKLNDGGKVAPHEIASKTQMFTERYMVDWLLQNSLGPMWLATCRKHGWTAEVEADGTLHRLEQRRTEWRARREAGEVSLTELMPLDGEAERRWAYYVPQPMPEDAIAQAPESVRHLKILDPAVGSGHFLVVAMDLLLALYREEARHRGEAGQPRWSDAKIVERILSHNLHGIDLDPRAVQMAAAALWLKAQQLAPGAHPERLNLVASNLRLSSLPDNDPALDELRRQVERETGIPGELTDTIVQALRGADHLGSLLKIDRAVEEALEQHESELGRRPPAQGDLFDGFAETPRQPMDREQAKATLLDRLESFLSRHSQGDDLGLRLRGAQLAAGVRFARLVREGTYDLVVANPPYQGTSKMAASEYVTQHYKLGKVDLYAAFLLRGLELVREGGVSAMLTMRNWMFIKQFAGLRKHLLKHFDLRAMHDLSSGAFEEISAAQVVVSVVTTVFGKAQGSGRSIALKAFGDTTVTQVGETQRKRAATLCQVARYEFDSVALKVVPEWPVVYWWDKELLDLFLSREPLSKIAPARQGLATANNVRFLRRPWELSSSLIPTVFGVEPSIENKWVPYIKGAVGTQWFEPLEYLVKWRLQGLEKQTVYDAFGSKGGGNGTPNRHSYFDCGIAFSMIGSTFSARVHRYPSIFGDAGSSVFPEDLASTVCAMNSTRARQTLAALNPTVNFQVGDVNRLPLFPIANASEIGVLIDRAFTKHESHREPSVEFKQPGPSPWRHAQAWAQTAVDRPEGEPLPPYEPELDPEPPTDHLSFALGVALGRFGPHGEGVLDPTKDDLSHALPAGLLFLNLTLDANETGDSLDHAATRPLHAAWETYGLLIGTQRQSLREWLALDFFKDVHKGMYDNRPIHWPLSSANRSFVAWVNIHRFDGQTLRLLLADHLQPALTRFEGRLLDLRGARDGADKKAAREAEQQFAKVKKARDELAAFVADVEQCADRGPLPTDAKCPAREIDARYLPDLDDGVMINSAALWALLEPQWKDPKKWWKQLAVASPKGNKDYDWSHLAMGYWPTRVDAKCQKDPSLGVAHGCFWRYHPQRAWAWELRLQDEIGPDFRIEEAPYRPAGRDLGDAGDGPHRQAWLRDHPHEALAAVEKEALRRMGRGDSKQTVAELAILEPGLWSALPREVWEMELRLSEKQKAEFCLRAPDEPEARAAYVAQHPQALHARQALLKDFEPAANLLHLWQDEAQAAVGQRDVSSSKKEMT